MIKNRDFALIVWLFLAMFDKDISHDSEEISKKPKPRTLKIAKFTSLSYPK